ncbi:unnamed protein product [Moneuplotes crassus]|uniref:EF-hand domain-containing protein n=1 Tax=Euplotes crassus TaxID=5936 RepID=A0AAD1Y6J7_EUPCR|nr:unnamed protein product [Moneuplotes crassus]
MNHNSPSVIIRKARKNVQGVQIMVKPNKSINFRTKKSGFYDLYNAERIPKKKLNKEKMAYLKNELQRKIIRGKKESLKKIDAPELNPKLSLGRSHNKSVMITHKASLSPSKGQETAQIKDGLHHYKFPGKIHSSMHVGIGNESPGSGNRYKRAQAIHDKYCSLPKMMPDRKHRNSSFQLDKSDAPLFLPNLAQKKNPVIKNIVDSTNVSKFGDSKEGSSTNGDAISVKLANLKMISPMTNLPKGYKKQLDKDSEELLRIFYSIRACSKEASMTLPALDPEVKISYTLVKNIRIKKSEFKNFIAKRYTTYIAERLINFFDFTKAWSYNDFVNTMEVLIFQSNEMLYKICFEALDYNNDGYISEIDLYQTMGELPTEIFISVLMEDFLKIIRYIVKSKIKKGTFDETKYYHKEMIKKIQVMNATYRSSLSGWNLNDKDKPSSNFFHFCTKKLSPSEKKPSEREDYALYPRSINKSVRNKSEQKDDSLKLSLKSVVKSNRKTLNKKELLFSYCEEKELNEKISLTEFNAIRFDTFVPSLAIDLIKYFCGYSKTKLQVLSLTSSSSSSSREYLKVHRNEIEFERLMKIIKLEESKSK